MSAQVEGDFQEIPQENIELVKDVRTGKVTQVVVKGDSAELLRSLTQTEPTNISCGYRLGLDNCPLEEI